jgi:hypothetical protein
MTVLWLIIWVLSHTPPVQIINNWNNWGIALAICLVIDILGLNR